MPIQFQQTQYFFRIYQKKVFSTMCLYPLDINLTLAKPIRTSTSKSLKSFLVQIFKTLLISTLYTGAGRLELTAHLPFVGFSLFPDKNCAPVTRLCGSAEMHAPAAIQVAASPTPALSRSYSTSGTEIKLESPSSHIATVAGCRSSNTVATFR